MHALVIDDSETMRMVVRRAGEKVGFEMAEAADCEAGLDCLSAMPVPELIIADWKMPRMCVGEFVQIVRSDPRCEHTFILVFASESGPGQMQNALPWGVNDCLAKPCTGEEIHEKLASIVRRIAAGMVPFKRL